MTRSVARIAELRKSSSQEEIAGADTEGWNVKCSRLYVLNVERQQLFLSGQTLKSRFIARTAINKGPGKKTLS